jgi:hypothetical protein
MMIHYDDRERTHIAQCSGETVRGRRCRTRIAFRPDPEPPVGTTIIVFCARHRTSATVAGDYEE